MPAGLCNDVAPNSGLDLTRTFLSGCKSSKTDRAELLPPEVHHIGTHLQTQIASKNWLGTCSVFLALRTRADFEHVKEKFAQLSDGTALSTALQAAFPQSPGKPEPMQLAYELLRTQRIAYSSRGEAAMLEDLRGLRNQTLDSSQISFSSLTQLPAVTEGIVVRIPFDLPPQTGRTLQEFSPASPMRQGPQSFVPTPERKLTIDSDLNPKNMPPIQLDQRIAKPKP